MSVLCRNCARWGAPGAHECEDCGSARLIAHPELASLTIAHIDCDAFYASVEKRDRPELRDRPVIVGGGRRGVVTTACYVARLSGVRSAMPMLKALRLCPEAVVLAPDFKKYSAESRRIFALARTLTPLVQTLSLDEAWLDLSGTERLHGAPPAVVLIKLQARIEQEIGIGVSIGLGPNGFLAKIASDLEKPRGFVAIGAAEAASFLAPRSVSLLPGVGGVFARALAASGLVTIGDIARADPKALAREHGERGLELARLARGDDERPVNPSLARKSISAETTFEHDVRDFQVLEDRLLPLCERVAQRARAESVMGAVVTLKLRRADFKIATRRSTLSQATQTTRTLASTARNLLRAEARGGYYRLIGVGLSNLVDSRLGAADLFTDEEARTLAGERVVDRLRARFGAEAVVRGRSLTRTGSRRGVDDGGA